MPETGLSKEQLKQVAGSLGFPLTRVCSVASLAEELPASQHPSRISEELRTLVVVAMKSPAGIGWARHRGTKQFWAGRILKRIDESCMRLVDHLERRGAMAMVLSSLSIDFDHDDSTGLCPAGQGSQVLRAAAVASGMGTWGLNQMVLTPEFGPRMFLGGVLADQEWEPDAPLDQELCPGLEECGRCAAVCPEDAIPRRAPLGASLAQVRRLDGPACARSAQPYGASTFLSHLEQVFGKRTGGAEALWNAVKQRTTGELWQTMIMMKEGAFTGCAECVQVCPAGEDYERVQRSPHRQRDLPGGVIRSVADGFIQIEHAPSQASRKQ